MPAQTSDEIAEAIAEIATCLARAIHELDPGAAQRMNFSAGLLYNRLLSENKPLAADAVYRFGRALLDREMFPLPEDADEESAGFDDGEQIDDSDPLDDADVDPQGVS
jgi:hypothetical protein